MGEIENIMNKIRGYLGNVPDKLSIIDEQIDINIQVKYFKQSGKVKKNIDKEKVLSKRDNLFKDKYLTNYKKNLLCQLASIEDVAAYRTIEKYLKVAPEEMHEWSVLAFHESKTLLEFSFLDENQIYIYTGLGGKNNKLRYNVIFLTKDSLSFNDTHKKVIKNEIDHILKNNDSENEKLEFSEKYASLIVLVPFKVNLQNLFDSIIDECNLYGNFLNKNFMITNVRIINETDIDKMIKKSNKAKELK